MLDWKAAATYILSAAALLGPLAYILFAFHEMGRLSYFDAPFDFLQISSFGIIPVATTIYPGILLTFMVGGLLSGARFAKGNQRRVLVIGALTYLSMILFYLSLTLVWQLAFGIASVAGIFGSIFINRNIGDLGKEERELYREPRSDEVKHYALIKLFFCAIAGAGVFVLFFSAAGKKEAVIQEQYWIFGNEVVLGFYGDLALLAERSGFEIGPKFRIVELKSITGALLLQRVGPLKPAPMWKNKAGRTFIEKRVDSPGSLL